MKTFHRLPVVVAALGAGLLFCGNPIVQSRVPLPPGIVSKTVIEEGIKASVGLGFEGLRRSLPELRKRFASGSPQVTATVLQSYYRLDRTRQYPHQPEVRELFTFRLVQDGAYFSLRVWTNGLLSANRVAVMEDARIATRPDWAPPILLNHLARDCGMRFGGEYLDNASDETYELVVRCEARDWPRGLGGSTRGYLTLEIPQTELFNRCLEPDFQVDVGTPGRPWFRPNGTDTVLRFGDLPIQFDIAGRGTTGPIRPSHVPNLVEANGRGPRITRLSAQLGGISDAKEF